jgi:hypothetical protein
MRCGTRASSTPQACSVVRDSERGVGRYHPRRRRARRFAIRKGWGDIIRAEGAFGLGLLSLRGTRGASEPVPEILKVLAAHFVDASFVGI